MQKTFTRLSLATLLVIGAAAPGFATGNSAGGTAPAPAVQQRATPAQTQAPIAPATRPATPAQPGGTVTAPQAGSTAPAAGATQNRAAQPATPPAPTRMN